MRGVKRGTKKRRIAAYRHKKRSVLADLLKINVFAQILLARRAFAFRLRNGINPDFAFGSSLWRRLVSTKTTGRRIIKRFPGILPDPVPECNPENPFYNLPDEVNQE
jgi:hypothetical protein